jgi:nicotinate-nucleotide--dimethylbenzimidazole phosphoribosyltransferase
MLLRLRSSAHDPAALLEAVGPGPLAGATGLVAQAARRRTPVLLGSSPVAVAAALLAERLAPGASAWCLAGCTGAAPAVRQALVELGLEPVLDLRLPGPGGALLADSLLRAALELLDA